jgi:7-cyano-7-deazaguanine synthase in queuosine biosynthesis
MMSFGKHYSNDNKINTNRNSIPQNEQVIIVWSGGLDSTALIDMMILDYNCEVYPLFINRGQGNYPFEKKAVNHYDRFFSQQSASSRYHHYWEIAIPIPLKALRSRLPREYWHILLESDIINQAVRYAVSLGTDAILIGSVPSDRRSILDGTVLEYLTNKTNEVRLGTGKQNLQVVAPFLLLDYDKKQIVAWSKANGLDLSQTRSCFRNRPEPCGECNACVRRNEALAQ